MRHKPKQRFTSKQLAYAALCVVVGMVLGGLSWSRCASFISQPTLSADTLNKNPASFLDWDIIGVRLMHEGRYAEAEPYCREALKHNPNYFEARYNLGTILQALRRLDESAAELQTAMKLRPEMTMVQNDYAATLMLQGKYHDAIDVLEAYIKSGTAAEPVARENLAQCLVAVGRRADAIKAKAGTYP